MIPNKDLLSILAKGILAPSADNLQPWEFRISQECVTLCLRPEKITGYCDAGYLAPYISAGAVLENMRVAAASLGYQMIHRFFPEPVQPLRIAEIHFTPASPSMLQQDPHAAVLDKRCTNRKFYDTHRQVTSGALEAIQNCIPSNEPFELMWMERKDKRYASLASIVGEADRMRFEIPRLHREFMNILRFKKNSSQNAIEGLPLQTLEAGPAAPIVFPLIDSWKRLSAMNLFGMSRSFGLYAKLQMLSSQAAGFLVSTSKNAEDYLRGGELMQRVWHETTRQGLSLQPMEGLPIFILNASVTGGEELSGPQHKTLAILKERFFNLFGIDNACGLIMLFRIGYSTPPSMRSPRRPLESFITRQDKAADFTAFPESLSAQSHMKG